MLQLALTRLDAAARNVAVDPGVLEQLRFPRETMQARLLVRMDDGSRRSFVAWRCRYDDTRGPTKGGIRFHPDSTADEVETLAFWMTMKCAVMNLPYGGGKGAVRVDPHELSRAELERLSRAYVHAFARLIGPDRDIPAPDVYTNSMIMGWMADEYASIVGQAAPAVITGKPIALGGSLGREDATARGGFHLFSYLARDLRISPGSRVAVQGFGNAGQHIARLLAGAGYRIVAVADSRDCVLCDEGFAVDDLIAAKRLGRLATLASAPGVRQIDPLRVVEVDCELFVPAALEDMIHRDNAGLIRAKVILELANGPVTPEADEILARRDVVVLPDILANAGGVTVSYFEWVQNRQGMSWPLEKVQTRLRGMMEAEGAAVWALSLEKRITLREAAYAHALARLASAIEAHGTRAFFAG
jgi:glutamate dehydrogenase (NADP+)